jgi:hypothetical protein
MSAARPKLSWHSLLAPIYRPPFASSATLDEGTERHKYIEASISNKGDAIEKQQVYSDPDLPFDITFTPDVLRQEIGLDGVVRTYVYEIKSFSWYARNVTLCESQASGYGHFTGAHTIFMVLYWKTGPDIRDFTLSTFKLERTPWNLLRKVALEAYAAMPSLK